MPSAQGESDMVRQSGVSFRACPVCGAHSGATLGHLAYALYDDLGIPGDKSLTWCDSCGMMYDDVMFTERELRDYYRRNEHYAVAETGGTGSRSADNLMRYDRIIDRLQVHPGSLILDIGCGQGGLVARCLERGIRAAGIEPSLKSRERASGCGLNVCVSVDEYIRKHPGTVPTGFVISHVLEHVMNPLDTMRTLGTYFPGVKVYLEVPDAESYLAADAIRWHELYFEHLNHFCSQSLFNLSVMTGIEVLAAGTCSFSPMQNDNRCLFITGSFSNAGCRPTEPLPKTNAPLSALPPVPGGDMPQGDAPIAVWGISQYAMLLMGSIPQLSHVVGLFDSSPAKIGRTIRGVRIEHPEEIRTLSQETVLVVPYSQYAGEMLTELEQKQIFSGKVVLIKDK